VSEPRDPFEGILTLADAADQLGLSPTTLAAQVRNGRMRARCFGKTWLTTTAEVARYREHSKGQPGRRPTFYKWSDIKRAKGAE
jgi:excisionase family DNA binding protein